jgi:hypothetical protein
VSTPIPITISGRVDGAGAGLGPGEEIERLGLKINSKSSLKGKLGSITIVGSAVAL